jgi:ligand-binding SRPBCC domain-containing protein
VIGFEYTSVIDAPVERVFAFHERPDALQLLIPPGQAVRVLEKSGEGIRAGARVVLGLPFGMRWVAVHTEFQANRLFVDIQESGPFHSWEHRHVFKAVSPSQTRLTDSLRVSLPPWGLPDLIVDWLVKRQLRSMFQYRHAVTKRQCELAS